MFNQIDDRNFLKFKREQINDNLIKRLELYGILGEKDGHEGCVNCIEWNYKGDRLCSVSDDCNIIIWDPFKKKKVSQFHSNHTGNIFAAKFLQVNHDHLLVTGSADSKCILHDLVTHDHLAVCECHKNRVKKLATSHHEPSIYWSVGDDGLCIQNDVRQNHICNQNKIPNVLIDIKNYCTQASKITAIATNQFRSEYIAIGSNDRFVRLYDRRMIKPMLITDTYDNIMENCVKYYSIGPTIQTKKRHGHLLTCTHLVFSPTGDELLASLSSDHVYLFNILNNKKPKIYSTDLSNLFGELKKDENKEFNLIDDTELNKKLKTSSNSNISQCSNSSSGSSVPIVKNLVKTKFNEQQASTSKFNELEEKIEDIEMNETVEQLTQQDNYNDGRKLIEQINKEIKPNLMIYDSKSKLPRNIKTLLKNAASFVKREKYSDAIELTNELINLMPNVSNFYCLRGVCYLNRQYSNDQYSALKDFYRALELDPNNKESHLKLAQALYDLGLFENAYQCLNYFSSRHNKDTRYKEYKELEKSITQALKQQESDTTKKKSTSSAVKNSYRNFYQNFTRNYFLNTNFSTSNSNANNSNNNSSTNNNSSNNNSESFLNTSSSSSSSSNSSTSSSSSDWSSLPFSNDDDHDSNDDEEHLYEISGLETSRIDKHTKNKKELQWRSESFDYEKRFFGHCNTSTDIMEANFFGDNYIVSGSDNGHFYIWNKKTQNIVNMIKADECIINCVQPHYSSCFLATSGIDNNIKLWSPTLNEEKMKEQEKTKRTEIMKSIKENNVKMNTPPSSSFNIMFLRVRSLSNDGEPDESDDEPSNYRQATLNLRECVTS